MSIKYYNLKIDGKFFKNFYDKLEAIKEYRNLEEKEKQIYEVIINDDGTQNEQLITINEVPFNEIKWYEIHNTIGEWDSRCTGRYRTLEEAKEGLKDKEDYYRHRGTGTIYECSINNRSFIVTSKEIYSR